MLSKGRVFSILGVFVILAFIFSGQGWFTVSMNPNDSVVILKSFDGYTTFAYLSPLLLVCLAGIATASISNGTTRLMSFLLGGLASSLLVALSVFNVVNQNLSGISKQIESATGIAATHGIKDLAVQVSYFASISIASYVLLAAAFGLAFLASRQWKAAVRGQSPIPAKKNSKDPISLWDEQR